MWQQQTDNFISIVFKASATLCFEAKQNIILSMPSVSNQEIKLKNTEKTAGLTYKTIDFCCKHRSFVSTTSFFCGQIYVYSSSSMMLNQVLLKIYCYMFEKVYIQTDTGQEGQFTTGLN